jgi:hypothetical protein
MKFGTATVSITTIPVTPEVLNVMVTPTTTSVQKGDRENFFASVQVVGGASQDVTWTIQGQQSASTAIDTEGILSVASDETTPIIVVKATSVFDNMKFGTATVTITEIPVTPEVHTIKVTPTIVSVQKGNTEQFTATVTAIGGADESVIWSVSGQNHVNTVIGSSGLLIVDAGETSTTIIVTATSNFNPSIYGTATVTITEIPIISEVISVKVTPETAEVKKGEAKNFSAEVQVTGAATQDVVWSVEGQLSAYTSIDIVGRLSVSFDESATNITVKATSVFDSTKFGTAAITITSVGISLYDDELTAVSLYPNPFMDKVYIQGMENSWLQITDMFGRPVYSTWVTKEEVPVSLGMLSQGVYIFTLRKDGKTVTLKGVKVN